MGFGRGGGRGWRNMFHATGQPGWMRWGAAPVPPQAPVDERTALEQQKNALQQSLSSIEQRLNELGDEAQ
jgi:hypothetical protein